MQAVLLMIILLSVLTGCSRATMNAQIAESIGTLGMYENNEPVETPKMKAQREIQEQKEAAEEELTGHLERAARLAASYDYEAALAELNEISEEHAEDDRVISARIEYQRLSGQMEGYGGDIAHLSVKSLIVDTERAFDDDDMAYYYNYWALTTEEFKAILQSLYDRGYVLMDVHESVVEVQNEDGTTSFAVNTPAVPEGKIPMVLSFTEANYYDYQEGDGFSGRMVLDDNGNVMNEYTDASGQTLVGAYDVVPIVDEFVEEHPDFSLRGAKGIISVTGYEGVFGYGIETGGSTIAAIADRLKETGWQIACQGFSDNTMESDMDVSELEDDLDAWSNKIGSLVGDTDLLIYPYGEEVTAGTDRQALLLEKGYQFFFSIWTTADFIEVQPDYVRQTRRTLDGYDLYMYADYLTDFFDADEILDDTRPAFE
ncbi:hypothetical protein [Marvinbryantia formatexigens]|uniref:hypothetical protein n=1 Tax=Marvinbryantia formatexigens TaxID=168384 RepID=UPI0002DBE135|nr:hypothetical protein [Marvinbryantia formatexigens]UWO24837.1 hypothetical protein NQ534_20910 [Marvinbryantia formatexigens DSM 14469]